jgi:hypothetical protein
MVRELSWYLDDNRFTNMAAELQGSVEEYESMLQSGSDEETVSVYREKTRELFEDHCVRSGLRDLENHYVNIDAEFFDGNKLNQDALDDFIKNILKGHCYQKVLWTYMGTTESFTQISKIEMERAGLKYEDYLPIEYKKNQAKKEPLNETLEDNVVPFYIYGDGSISTEYFHDKARLQFDTLADTSGVNWGEGYDPNGNIKKEGWHGGYDAEGTWVRIDETENAKVDQAGWKPGTQTIEVLKDGDTAILYDPGMILLSPEILLYLTEAGEEYGKLRVDQRHTVEEIQKTLKELGVSKIGAISVGIAMLREDTVEQYRAVLGELATEEIEALSAEKIQNIREAQRKAASESIQEKKAVALEQAIHIAGLGMSAGELQRAIADGAMTVPLSPGNRQDGIALGLNEREIEIIHQYPVSPEKSTAFNAILSNIYAAWPAYEKSGMSKADAAQLAYEYVEGKLEHGKTLNTETDLKAIVGSSQEDFQVGINRYASGIPGIFTEPETVNFYDPDTKEQYVRSLEKKRVLPKGGAEAALTALSVLPEAALEQKDAVNRSLTRVLGQYKAIAMSVGMPIGEVIRAALDGSTGSASAVLNKKVYYELPLEKTFKAAAKGKQQTREISLALLAEESPESPAVIIGGTSGKPITEEGITRAALETEYGYETKEAEVAAEFLQGIRMTETADVAFKAELYADIRASAARNQGKGIASLRKDIYAILGKKESTAYNLASDIGLTAYTESARYKRSGLKKEQLENIITEQTITPVQSITGTKIIPHYKSAGETATPTRRVSPRGTPEKLQANVIRLEDTKAAEYADTRERTFSGEEIAATSSLVRETTLSDGGFNRTTLEEIYGYTAEEAAEAEEFLHGITLPEIMSVAVMADLFAEIRTAVIRNRGKDPDVLRADVLAVLEEKEKAISTPPVSVIEQTLSAVDEMRAEEATLTKAPGEATLSAGGFDQVTLEDIYGYTAEEAVAVEEFLHGIMLPKIINAASMAELYAGIQTAVIRNRNMSREALQADVLELLEEKRTRLVQVSDKNRQLLPKAESGTESRTMTNAAAGTTLNAVGFDRVTLENLYGYTAKEALEAEEFLQSIEFPEILSATMMAEFYIGIQKAVISNRGKGREALQADLLAVFTENDKTSPALSGSNQNQVIPLVERTLENPVAIGLDNAETVASIGGFDRTILEEIYGYSTEEALEAGEFLHSIKLPEILNTAIMAVLYAGIQTAVVNNRGKGREALQVDVQSVLKKKEKANTALAERTMESSSTISVDDGKTVTSIGGFDRTILEEIYGYSVEEALEADGFLHSILLPETLNAAVMTALYAGIQTAVVNNRGKGREALQTDVFALLEGEEKAIPGVAESRQVVSLENGTVENPIMLSTAIGETAVSMGGFDRTVLEEIYGYTTEEADEADGFLQGIGLPEVLSATVLADLYVGLQTAVVRNRGKGRQALRGDVLTMLGNKKWMGHQTTNASSNATTQMGSFQGTLDNGRTEVFNLPETDSEYTMQNPARSVSMEYSGIDLPAHVGGYNAESNQSETTAMRGQGKSAPLTWGPVERGQTFNGGHFGRTDESDTIIVPSGVPAIANLQKEMPSTLPMLNVNGSFGETGLPISGSKSNVPIRDLELERLRRIEANYEKDKAMLAKEQAPALARRDSHDVGQADMEAQNETDGNEEGHLLDDFLKMVKSSLSK